MSSTFERIWNLVLKTIWPKRIRKKQQLELRFVAKPTSPHCLSKGIKVGQIQTFSLVKSFSFHFWKKQTDLRTEVGSSWGGVLPFDFSKILDSSSAVFSPVDRRLHTPVAVAVARHWCLAKLIMTAVDVENVEEPNGIFEGNIGKLYCSDSGCAIHVFALFDVKCATKKMKRTNSRAVNIFSWRERNSFCRWELWFSTIYTRKGRM